MRGASSEKRLPPGRQFSLVFRFVADHGAEEFRRLRCVVQGHLVEEFLIPLFGLFFDENGEIQGILKTQIGEIDLHAHTGSSRDYPPGNMPGH